MPSKRLTERISKRLRVALKLRTPLVLMYHRVGNESFDPWELVVEERRFREQMMFLRAHRTPISLVEFVALLRRGKLPRTAVAVTFDDGYACNVLRAARLLFENHIPATIFITTRPVIEAREFWWDELERVILAIDDERLALELPDRQLEIFLGPRRKNDREWPPGATARTPRQSAYYEAWSALRQLGPDQQRSILDNLRSSYGISSQPRESHRPMGNSEVRDLRKFGIDVGAHSLTHTSLPSRNSDEKRSEIDGSRDACADMTGVAPRTFAYPYGDFDDETARLVEASGFDCACTTVEASVLGANLYRLPRIQVRNWSAREFAKALVSV